MTDTSSSKAADSTISRRSLTGVVSLISRSFIVQAISLAATFLLTVFLEPAVFGVFYLVSAVVNFFVYFSDIGLAAALIQKKESLTDADLKTTFFVQSLLVLFLVTLLFILTPLLTRLYQLEPAGQWLIYALGISFVLSSLKTIPSVMLERELKFNLLIIPQIVETIVFNLVVVFFAWRQAGIASFTYAVLARGVSGLLVMYLVNPWKPGWQFSKPVLSRLLRFGLPFQANTIIAVIKDDLMTVFLGRLIGPTGLGYLGWAKKWSEMPLRFFMDNVNKVTFPAYARLQDDPVKLRQAVEKSLFFLAFLTFPILLGFSYLASDLVKIIPRYLKWQPALIPLYLYAVNSAFAVVSTTMTNLFNATGRIKITFRLMLMWLGLTWIFYPLLGFRFGYLGVSWAVGLISLSSVVAIYLGWRYLHFNLVNPLLKPLIASALMLAVLTVIRPLLTPNPPGIVLLAIAGGLAYGLSSYILIGPSLLADFKTFFASVKKTA